MLPIGAALKVLTTVGTICRTVNTVVSTARTVNKTVHTVTGSDAEAERRARVQFTPRSPRPVAPRPTTAKQVQANPTQRTINF